MFNGSSSKNGKTFRNFIPMWPRSQKNGRGPVATGKLNLEDFCKVLVHNEVIPRDAVAEIFKILKSHMGDNMTIPLAFWENTMGKSDKSPKILGGISIPKEDSSSSNSFAKDEEVPF